MLRKALTLALPMMLLPGLAFAQRFEVTPFVGYRFGGEIENADFQEERFDFEDDNSLGLILDIAVNENAFVEILVSAQETTLQDDRGFFGDQPLFEIDVNYLHIGGLYQWKIREGVKPFVVATLGVTDFEPQAAGLSGESFFSMGIGGGVKLMLAKNIGFRFEARGYSTVLDADDESFCDPHHCYRYDDGTYLWQFEAGAGLILAF